MTNPKKAFERLKNVVDYQREALEKAAHVPEYAKVRVLAQCWLCRRWLKSPKSASRTRGVCLSCHMRRHRFPKLNVERHAIRRWRRDAGLTAKEFAAYCGWTKSRQCRLEHQDAVNRATATVLATAMIKASVDGRVFDLAAKEWPLSSVLVTQELVEVAARRGP